MNIVITARLTFFIFSISVIFSASFLGQPLSDKNISLICSNEPLRNVLDEIRIQADVNFVFQDELIDDKNITCSIKDSRVKNAVQSVLAGSNISFKKFGEKVFVLFKERKPVKTSYKAIVVDQDPAVSNRVVSFTKPEIIYGDNPVYPAEAVKHNIEGNVKIRFLISKAGDVEKIVIEKTSGSGILDSAAIDYINKLKFTPATENGINRSVWMAIILRYLVIDN